MQALLQSGRTALKQEPQAPSPDFNAIETRRQAARSSGDYGVARPRLQIARYTPREPAASAPITPAVTVEVVITQPRLVGGNIAAVMREARAERARFFRATLSGVHARLIDAIRRVGGALSGGDGGRAGSLHRDSV